MIKTVEIFLHKPAIMKKAESYLNELKEAMARELAAQDRPPFPPGTDLIKGQVARGENNKGFPFLSLDIPQYFSKTEMFTFRTLFWWGHYLGFSLILKGEKLNQCLERLTDSRKDPAWADVFIASSPTPWEWDRTQENFKNVSQTTAADMKTLIGKIQYMKLCRFFPVDDPTFPSADWTVLGLEAWRTLSTITKPA